MTFRENERFSGLQRITTRLIICAKIDLIFSIVILLSKIPSKISLVPFVFGVKWFLSLLKLVGVLMLKKALMVVAFVAISACNKKSKDENKSASAPFADKPIINVAGKWDSFDGTDPNHAIFDLTQNNVSVNGSFNLNSGAMVATLNGSCDTNIFTFTLTEPPPCPGTFTGSATYNGAELHGSFTGSDCAGPATVTFQLHRI